MASITIAHNSGMENSFKHFRLKAGTPQIHFQRKEKGEKSKRREKVQEERRVGSFFLRGLREGRGF